MSQSTRLLAMLQTGPKSTAELLREVPCIVHSRIAELRARGYAIEHETRGKGAAGSVYTLVSSREADVLAAVPVSLADSGHAPGSGEVAYRAAAGASEPGPVTCSGSGVSDAERAALASRGDVAAAGPLLPGPEQLPLLVVRRGAYGEAA